MMTMPTWDVKSARIVTLSPPYALAPPFVDTTPNNSVIFEIVLEEGSPDFVNVLVVGESCHILLFLLGMNADCHIHCLASLYLL